MIHAACQTAANGRDIRLRAEYIRDGTARGVCPEDLPIFIEALRRGVDGYDDESFIGLNFPFFHPRTIRTAY